VTPATQQEIDRFWAEELGSNPEALSTAPTIFCTAQQMYDGVQFFERNRRIVLAAPPKHADRITKSIRSIPRADVFSVEFVERLLSPEVEKILGPTHVAYADASTFLPSTTSDCRLLTPEDASVYAAFREALSPEELEQSGFNTSQEPAFGRFAEGQLVAAAYYQLWPPCIAHITVATHPQFRRKGHASAVVSALAEYALARNLILQYRALFVNTNSLKLGQSLGFEHYCSTIYARLRLQ
jgi:GNAT superfamily N-acetyltransferase